MSRREPSGARSRGELYDGFARVGRAMGGGRRLEILDFLSQGPRSVGQLAAEIGQSVANTSQHLQVLQQAGLVTGERHEHRVIYRVRRPQVTELLGALCDLAVDEIPDVAALASAHLGNREDVGWISRRELSRRLRSGEVVVIDVRSEHDFACGHIVGARWVPSEQLDELARTLDASVEVVAYCRGEYCLLADVAVLRLRSLGLRARRLEGGFPLWVAKGGDYERTA